LVPFARGLGPATSWPANTYATLAFFEPKAHGTSQGVPFG
jgi:hypothetical protein